MPSQEANPKGRLLIVDDEENILRALKRALRRDEWQIETATTGAAGLEALERFSPAVVISDFRMPGMNGVEFLTHVKLRAPRTQRIMLTGHADQSAIEEAINRSEIFRFISKPWNDSQLTLTVSDAFAQFDTLRENARLHELTEAQNRALRQMTVELEQRVEQRTRMLSVAKREWELTFDSIDVPLAVVSTTDLTVRRANLAYSRLAGKEVTEITRSPKCHQFLFGRTTPCDHCPLGAEQGSTGRAEIRHGEKLYVLHIDPMVEEGQAVCSYRDVTEERERTRRMMDTEKMAAVGHLAGGVAHEINNPLGGILAFAQLMKRDAGRTPDDQEALDLIEQAALRCKRIVESLLKFSRRSRAEDRRPFDVAKCVDDAVVLFRAQLKGAPMATLQVELDRTVPDIYGDPNQLAQVLLNLLQNGLHALPEQTGKLRIELVREASRLALKVSDTGTGIKPADLPHIFEPSFTTKPPGEGTGLGLAIAYRIVEDHGGSFQVDTELGKGSQFTVYLPLPPADLTVPPEA